MCGRFGQFNSYDVISESLKVNGERSVYRYNIAPGGMADVIRYIDSDVSYASLRWGLVPPWAKDENFGFKTFNARSETVHEKPAFKNAFKKKRCLIPMDGFFEWRKEAGSKQPYFIRRPDQSPLLVAGLWERKENDDQPLETFTVITCNANNAFRDLYERMPAILPPEHWEQWLDGSYHDSDQLRSLLVPTTEPVEFYPVSPKVNDAKNDSPELIVRADPLTLF